jgi:protein-disulfide isomerase
MIQKKHLYAIFLPAILLVLTVFSFRLYQYITIFISPFDTATSDPLETFTIPISSYDAILGDKKAPNTVVIFEDVQCEHCATLYSLTKEFEKKHPKTIKIIWKPTSIVSIPFSSETAHTYLMCAKEQDKFTPYLEMLFANQGQLSQETLNLFTQETGMNADKLATCLSDVGIRTYLDETKQLAEFLQIQSVPALFWNNRQIPAPITISEFETLLGIK